MQQHAGGFDLVGIGVSCVDCIYYLDQLPALDTKCSARELVIQGGGVGANIVWAAARMGMNAALISKTGDDPFGQCVFEESLRMGIETAGIVVQRGGRTPLTAIMVDDRTHSRTCIHNRSGLAPLSRDEVKLDLCRKMRTLVSDGRYVDATWACLPQARASAARVVMAIEHLTEATCALCAQSDLVILPGKFLDRDQLAELGVRELAQRTGARNLVVTLGEEGSLLLAGNKFRAIPATAAKVIVDTVGAGDVFAAALCFAIVQGDSLEVGCRFANAVAASSCAAVGSREGIPPPSELNGWLEHARLQGLT